MAKQYPNTRVAIEQEHDKTFRTFANTLNLFVLIVQHMYSALSGWMLSFLSSLSFGTNSSTTDSSTTSSSTTDSPSTVDQHKKRQDFRSFKHTPLRSMLEFRLLEMRPGRGDDPLICNLRHFDLSDCSRRNNPSYEALSYVWGSSRPSQPILCNGKRLNITTSLRSALCRVRQPQRSIFVWADAICIDQSDLRERKVQVNLMRLIYAQAKMVSICLLDEMNHSDDDLGVLNSMFHLNISKIRRNTSASSPRTPLDLVFFSGLKGSPFDASHPYSNSDAGQKRELRGTISAPLRQKLAMPAWGPIAEFFDNAWFSRIWVVQEVAESKNARVLFGGLEIPWQDIVSFATLVHQHAGLRAAIFQFAKTKGIHNVLFMNNKITMPSHDPIPTLLQSTRDFGASDPRDKIYAVLHRPIRTPRTYVDVPLLPGQTYVEFFAQSLCLLYLSSIILDHTLTAIRFWCLLLSLGTIAHHLRYHHSIRLLAFDFYHRFVNFLSKLDRIIYSRFEVTDTLNNMLEIDADYSLTAPSVYRMLATRLIDRSRKLNVLSYVNHGATIDITYPSWVPRWDCSTGGIVVLTSLPNHGYRCSADMKHTLPASLKHTDHLVVEGVRFSTIASASKVIASIQFPQMDSSQRPTLSNVRANVINDQTRDDKYPTGESIRRAHFATLTAGRLGHIEHEGIMHTLGGLQQRVASALLACQGRRQFVTENGYVGMGPAAMQSGDIVCVLFGGCVPYVLRSTDTDGLYRVVGESYVHGIMRGEVIEGWRGGKFTKARITLC